MDDWRELLAGGLRVAGVDEAGRGPLAGDVFAAAVVLAPGCTLPGLRDSKKLGAARREALAEAVRAEALAWSVARASVAEIDALNILQASLLAMRRAVQALAPPPAAVLVDGNRLPAWEWRAVAVVGGDDLVPAISAASVLAKVARDEEMRRLDERYPGYGFARHKGYPTAAHVAALLRLGASPVHRMSFAPVRAAAAQYAADSC
ncbi:MAG: Ribonuclease HII [Pseudomonadales bacterium]|nr:Ribonuclease HII [Pseudomonadales bacterium]